MPWVVLVGALHRGTEWGAHLPPQKTPKVNMSNLCHQEKSPELPAPDFSKDEAKALAMAPQKIVRIPMFDIGIYICYIYMCYIYICYIYICYIYIYILYIYMLCYIYIYVIQHWVETCNILAGFCNQYVSYLFDNKNFDRLRLATAKGPGCKSQRLSFLIHWDIFVESWLMVTSLEFPGTAKVKTAASA